MQGGWFVIIGTALAMSVLTLVVVARIWSEAFWKAAPQPAGGAPNEAGAPQGMRLAMIAPVAVLMLLLVLVGLGAGGVYEVAMQAATQLLDPAGYIGAVLGS